MFCAAPPLVTSFPVASPPHHHRSTWSQSGAASNSHPAPVGISTPVGLGGSWGKNTWFRLCWSTLDRRSSTTLARIPSSYTYTTITPVPVTILKELISRELVQIINKEQIVTLERGSAATTTRWTSSPGPGFLPHKNQNINVDGTGPVRFNLN